MKDYHGHFIWYNQLVYEDIELQALLITPLSFSEQQER